jgi:hypothetical protein
VVAGDVVATFEGGWGDGAGAIHADAEQPLQAAGDTD